MKSTSVGGGCKQRLPTGATHGREDAFEPTRDRHRNGDCLPETRRLNSRWLCGRLPYRREADDRGQDRARGREFGQDGQVVPGEVAVEVFGGHAAAAAKEGFEPFEATVDGVEVEVAAAALAGLVV